MFNIYCDNAAEKRLTKTAMRTIYDFLERSKDIGNPSAIHIFGKNIRRDIETARTNIAKYIGANNSREIYFTSGSTEAINWIMQTTNRNIITTLIEHKAIRANADYNSDKCVYSVPVDETGRIDMVYLKNLCETHDNMLLCIGYVNNEIGTIQDIKEITKVCHKNNVLVFVDATQALGNLPVNVANLDVDYLCGSFHKLGGLSGSGFLYCKQGVGLEPFMRGGSQEKNMRAGTENTLGILVGEAVMREAYENLDSIKEIERKRNLIIDGLLKIPLSHLNGSSTYRVCNNINISFDGVDGETLVMWLGMYGIYCSTGSACNSQSIVPSFVLRQIGLSNDMARSAIRLTIDNDITGTDIDNLIQTITIIVDMIRNS